VYQHIDATEMIERLFRRIFTGLLIAQIRLDQQRAPPECTGFIRDVFRAIGIAAIHNRQIEAIAREAAADAAADAATATGDQRNPPIVCCRHFLLPISPRCGRHR
jgi:hypothetical protein